MGFWDAVGGTIEVLAETAKEVATTPQVQYELGKSAGLAGEPRHVFTLGRDDGSEEWARLKDCRAAYNQGYDDGRYERLQN